MTVEENLRLFQTLDDAWNARDWDTFNKRHSENVAVYWPGQPEPTRGRHAHHQEAMGFFKAFDNRLDNRPYKILFGNDDYTCSVARWTGKNIGPFTGPDGQTIPATNKKFELEFCTVAHWKNGEIVEERLFYDLVGMLKQLGITLTGRSQPVEATAV
ncbi:ester cyclase [archaeon 13_1_40CM_2_52_13]|nr:MAG: ester cyclase [archaeon 13_1_40CM_2_52_13]OLE68715.1 MAG: ester cyclase [archaeon 13_1_20CM_2_51_12]TMI39536.1 MAG: ester cyclase [Candidatus Bathyarchaeota archaeon]